MDTETMHALCNFGLPPPSIVMCRVFYKRVRTDSEYCLPVSGTKWIAHIPRLVQHTLSCSGYHFRWVFILKMLSIPPSSISKHMHSLLPHPTSHLSRIFRNHVSHANMTE